MPICRHGHRHRCRAKKSNKSVTSKPRQFLRIKQRILLNFYCGIACTLFIGSTTQKSYWERNGGRKRKRTKARSFDIWFQTLSLHSNVELNTNEVCCTSRPPTANIWKINFEWVEVEWNRNYVRWKWKWKWSCTMKFSLLNSELQLLLGLISEWSLFVLLHTKEWDEYAYCGIRSLAR